MLNSNSRPIFFCLFSLAFFRSRKAHTSAFGAFVVPRQSHARQHVPRRPPTSTLRAVCPPTPTLRATHGFRSPVEDHTPPTASLHFEWSQIRSFRHTGDNVARVVVAYSCVLRRKHRHHREDDNRRERRERCAPVRCIPNDDTAATSPSERDAKRGRQRGRRRHVVWRYHAVLVDVHVDAEHDVDFFGDSWARAQHSSGVAVDARRTVYWHTDGDNERCGVVVLAAGGRRRFCHSHFDVDDACRQCDSVAFRFRYPLRLFLPEIQCMLNARICPTHGKIDSVSLRFRYTLSLFMDCYPVYKTRWHFRWSQETDWSLPSPIGSLRFLSIAFAYATYP